MDGLPVWLRELAPIALLLVVVAIVILRLPKIDLGHSAAFKRRRTLNWLPLGLTYSFLYMGRYNLQVSKGAFEQMRDAAGGPLMGNDDFGFIFAAGTVIYGVAFVLNGPLTDRVGGKKAILAAAIGTAVANALMAVAAWSLVTKGPGHDAIATNFLALFSLLYGLNMYFQSFGAVAIVKVNAPWFHVRERGVFGAIFGILISLGIYFAFDWGKLLLDHTSLTWVFGVPALVLVILLVFDIALVKDTPGEAGQTDFDTADASSGDDGPRLGAVAIFSRMLRNPIIMTIACIEFCSGFLRQAIMQWYRTYAKQTDGVLGLADSFVYDNWGMILCCAGILGGVVAGVISDHVFQSRRGPVAAILYFGMLVGGVVLTFTYDTSLVGPLVVVMSLCVIGVHGMLSGTASMDFGGKKNVGTVVGIIDGFVYLGTGTMSITYAVTLPKEQLDAAGKIVGPATDPQNWLSWPLAMIPFAIIGSVLALRVWNAKPQPRTPVSQSTDTQTKSRETAKAA
jgi:OPA family glycerol-3-phosphate transporter-like MFS transporter